MSFQQDGATARTRFHGFRVRSRFWDPRTMILAICGPPAGEPRIQFFWKKHEMKKGAKLIRVFLDFFWKSVSKFYFVRRFKRAIDPLGISPKTAFFHFFKKVFHSPPYLDLKIFYSQKWMYSEPLNIAVFWKKINFFWKKVYPIPFPTEIDFFFQKNTKFFVIFENRETIWTILVGLLSQDPEISRITICGSLARVHPSCWKGMRIAVQKE